MADSIGDESDVGALGLIPSLASSLPVGHSTNGATNSSPSLSYPPHTVASPSGIAAVNATPGTFGNPNSGTHLVALSPNAHATSPLHGVGLGLGSVAGAGLLTQMHATSWDPTLSTDWDNEKASVQCILRIKR